MDSPDWDDEVFGDDVRPEDAGLDEAVRLILCPFCGAEIYKDAEQCPACRRPVAADRHRSGPGSWFWLSLAVVAIVALILAASWLLL